MLKNNFSHLMNCRSSLDRQTMAPISTWFVYLVSFVFVFAGLGSYSISDNNEGLYAQISREMLRSGDWRQWVIPRLNTLVYMEKPPLLYWLTAMSFALFGESAWSARFVPSLSALSTVAVMLRFGRYLERDQAARLSAIIFISGVGVTVMSRNLMFDMLLTVLLSVALMLAYVFVVDAKNRRALRYSMGFLALTVLAKGFVCTVLYAAVLGFLIVSISGSLPDFIRRCRLWLDWRAFGIFVLIAAPWHVLASFVEPFFAWFYFVNEHILRFFGVREPQDYYSGPWWYYLPRMMIYLFPWSFLLLGLAWARLRSKSTPLECVPDSMVDFEPRSELLPSDHLQLMKFLTAAWMMPLVFFSLSNAKANYYLVIVMPFAALQLSILLRRARFGGVFGRVIPGVLAGVLFLLLTLNVHFVPSYMSDFSIYGLDGIQFLTTAVYALTMISFAAAMLAWKQPRIGVLWYLALPASIVFVLLSVLSSASQLNSSSLMAQRILSTYPDRQVLFYRGFEERSSLPFYLKSPIKTVESGGPELFWGQRLYGRSMTLSHREFAELMQSRKIVLVVQDHDLEQLGVKTYAPNLVRKEEFLGATLYFN